MNIMEYIAEERKRQGMTGVAFAEKLPVTRQRAEAIIAEGDGQFQIVRTMLNVLGKDIDVRTKEGNEPDFDREEFMAVVAASKAYFHKEEEIISSMGLTFVIVDLPASDSALEEKEN